MPSPHVLTGPQATDRLRALLADFTGSTLQKSMDAGHATGTETTNQVTTGSATKKESLDEDLKNLAEPTRKRRRARPAPAPAENDLQKALDDLVKGAKDLGRLTKKTITNSKGVKTTVYVNANGEEPGAERAGGSPPPADPDRPAPTGHQLNQFAQGTETQKLLAHISKPGVDPAQARVAKHVLAGRGVDIDAELAKIQQPTAGDEPQQTDKADKTDKKPDKADKADKEPAATDNPAAPDAKTLELTKDWSDEQLRTMATTPGVTDEMRQLTKRVLDHRQASKQPKPAAPAKPAQPAKKASKDDKTAPGTPADWQGDTSTPEAVRKAVDVNIKGITKIADKLINGNDVTGIIYGSGGAGKTYNVEQELKKNGKKAIKLDDPSTYGGDYVKFTGKITPKAVYEQMFKFKDKLLIFDDCDSALANEDTVNMFKGALDTAETRTVSRVTPEGKAPAKKKAAADKFDQKAYDGLRKKIGAGTALSPEEKAKYTQLRKQKDGVKTSTATTSDTPDQELPNSFDFTGKILFITNKKPNPDALQPILSRGSDHDATMDKDEILYSMSKALGTIPVRPSADGKQPTVPWAERQEIYGFIKKNKDKFADLSMRDFSKVYEDKKYAERQGLDWQQEAQDTLDAQAQKAGIKKGLANLAAPYDELIGELTGELVKALGELGSTVLDLGGSLAAADYPELEKGAKVAIGTITTLRDGRKTIKTDRGWRIYYGKDSKERGEKTRIATNFEVAGKKYAVSHTPGEPLTISREDGRAYTKNSKALRAVLDAYKQEHINEFRSANFIEGHYDMSADDMALEVAENSSNPQEVALEWLNQPADKMGYKDQMIMEHLGAFPLASFRRFGDKNQLAGTNIRRNYLSEEGTALDVQAANISETAGIDISEEDIIEFVMQFPRGQQTAAGHNPIRQRLAERFLHLTGFEPDEAYAHQLNSLSTLDSMPEAVQQSIWEECDDCPF